MIFNIFILLFLKYYNYIQDMIIIYKTVMGLYIYTFVCYSISHNICLFRAVKSESTIIWTLMILTTLMIQLKQFGIKNSINLKVNLYFYEYFIGITMK